MCGICPALAIAVFARPRRAGLGLFGWDDPILLADNDLHRHAQGRNGIL